MKTNAFRFHFISTTAKWVYAFKPLPSLIHYNQMLIYKLGTLLVNVLYYLLSYCVHGDDRLTTQIDVETDYSQCRGLLCRSTDLGYKLLKS